MRLVHPVQLLRVSEPLAMLYKGDEERNRLEEQCEKLAGVDALSKGVVTTWDTRDIPTPPRATREKITARSWDTTEKSTNPSIDELAGG